MLDSPWNSLEVTKLSVAVLTPIALALLGVYLARLSKRFEHFQWRNQRLIEKRISVYDDLAPLLNDLLCYFTFVGLWKEVTPPQAIALKRVVDKKIYLAAPLFAPSFFEAATRFIDVCYAPFQGWGRDARLRTPVGRRRDTFGSGWQTAWDECFSDKTATPEEVQTAYQDVMRAFSVDIGLFQDASPGHLGRHPFNFSDR